MGTIFDHILFFSSSIADNTVLLDPEETRHATAVLRMKEGDSLFVTDGMGRIYCCQIDHIDKKSCTARIAETRAQQPPQPVIHFFVGLPQKEAFEEVLMGLVPLGVMHITPLVCRFCQKKWWQKQWEKQAERFHKKIITAAKQSWNAWLPSLDEPVPFRKAMALAGRNVLVADKEGNTLDQLLSKIIDNETLSCFVGPPGGFSPDETEDLKQHGSLPVKLADHRLRTELAAAVFAGNIIQSFPSE